MTTRQRTVRRWWHASTSLTGILVSYPTTIGPNSMSRFAEKWQRRLEITFAESKVAVSIEVGANRISAGREDGTELMIQVYGPEIFEITRWPNPADAVEDGIMRFDLAAELESGVAVTLARRYVVNGTIEQENA